MTFSFITNTPQQPGECFVFSGIFIDNHCVIISKVNFTSYLCHRFSKVYTLKVKQDRKS